MTKVSITFKEVSKSNGETPDGLPTAITATAVRVDCEDGDDPTEAEYKAGVLAQQGMVALVKIISEKMTNGGIGGFMVGPDGKMVSLFGGDADQPPANPRFDQN